MTVGAAMNVKVPAEVPVPFGGRHADGDCAGAGCGDGGDLRGGVHDVARRVGAAELHRGCSGEAGAGDDDARAAASRAGRRREASDRRRRDVGEGSGRSA